MRQRVIIVGMILLIIGMMVPATSAALGQPGGMPTIDSSGGSWINGTTTPSKTWYFSECNNAEGYDTWLTVANTSEKSADVEVEYYTPYGTQAILLSVAPRGSHSVEVGDVVTSDAFIKVISTEPVLASRTVSNPENVETKLGSPNLSKTFYFAEGETHKGFQEWLQLSNFSEMDASCTVKYYTATGLTVDKEYTVPALARVCLNVNGDVGANEDVSTMIVSDQPILAERTIQANYGNIEATMTEVGATSTSTTWSFAPGITESGFDDWLMLWNMGPSQAIVEATYYPANGEMINQEIKVEPMSRSCVSIRATVGDGKSSGINLKSSQPIVCEKSTYWDYDSPVMNGNCKGGSVLLGSKASPKKLYLPGAKLSTNCEEWICIANFNEHAAEVNVNAYTSDGLEAKTYVVPGTSSQRVNLNQAFPSCDEIHFVEVASNASVMVQGAIFYTAAAAPPTEPVTTWHMAEGATAGGFETWVLVQNPTNKRANVNITYQTSEGEVEAAPIIIEPKTRQSINVGETVQSYDVSTTVKSDVPVVCERTVYFKERNCAHSSIGITEPVTTWHMAEGATAGGFETWVLVQNPTNKRANVNITYQTSEGEVEAAPITLEPKTRQSINVGETVQSYDVSTTVKSDVPVVCERTVYFKERNCAHSSIGITEPVTTWHMAEGATAGGFETWVLVQNPTNKRANVNITYQTSEGEVEAAPIIIEPKTRQSINVGETVQSYDVSTTVKSDVPVVCERTVYFKERNCAHSSIGITEPVTTWHMAEGATAGGFETWVLVQNPTNKRANVNITYQTSEGEVEAAPIIIEPKTRQSINVGETVQSYDVSTTVKSDVPVVCERTVYFKDKNCAHSSIGHRIR